MRSTPPPPLHRQHTRENTTQQPVMRCTPPALEQCTSSTRTRVAPRGRDHVGLGHQVVEELLGVVAPWRAAGVAGHKDGVGGSTVFPCLPVFRLLRPARGRRGGHGCEERGTRRLVGGQLVGRCGRIPGRCRGGCTWWAQGAQSVGNTAAVVTCVQRREQERWWLVP
jgi:hypothetical protein